MFVLLIILDAGEVLSVLARLNDATPAFLCLVCLAVILLAMSIGFVHVAGSATTLPFLGPDVHRNFRCRAPLVPLPNTLPTASVTGSQGNNS